MSDDKDITLPSYERAATIHPESYGHWDRAQISDLLHERDALRAMLRKDAARWRYFRDECDDGDKLHMIAAGTAHYDTTIDALAAVKAQEKGK